MCNAKIAWMPALACLCLWAVAGAAEAGVYNFAEERVTLDPRYFDKYREALLELRDVAIMATLREKDPRVTPPERIKLERPFLQRHLLATSLDYQDKWEGLPWEQKLNLSGYWIRANRLDEKHNMRLLEELARKKPDPSIKDPDAEFPQFLVQANLATAHFLLGNLDKALQWQEAALDAFPTSYDLLSEKQKDHLAKCGWVDHDLSRKTEEYFLALIKERLEEKRRGKPPQTVDALFKDKDGKPLRFVNEAGEYEPGKLAAAELAKLPKNHLDVVKQLVLWLPMDNRLVWQLGELLAVQGDLAAARQIMVVDLAPPKVAPRRMPPFYDIKEFHEHRSFYEKMPIPEKKLGEDFNAFESKVNKTTEEAPSQYPWRDMTLAFMAGMGVALFVYWQFREIRRRHQRG